MDASLAAVLAKLQLENDDLQARLSPQDPYPRSSQQHQQQCFSVSSSREHLERELQRARNKHDQALQRRQQQVVELQQLIALCEEMLPGAPRHKQESPVQRIIGQLEAQLAAVSRHMQCATSMQLYLQQAQQQHKQELLQGEAQVRCMKDALGKAQDELKQAKEKLIKTRTSRAAAKQAVTNAEQQLAAGRQKRATLQRQLAQQCQLLVVAPGAWDQVTALCGGASSAREWLPEAARVGVQVMQQQQQQQVPVLHDQPEQGDACSCLSSLLCYFGCGDSTAALIAKVRAQLAAGANLRAVLAAASSSVAGKGADAT